MSLSQVIIPLFTHLLPVLFFVYMGVDVLLRNPGKAEHRLVSAIILCCMLLFLEEYVRNMLPIEYSPTLAAVWFSTVGIMIPGLGFHLFMKLARLEEKMPKFIYPYCFYLPVLVILVNLLVNDSIISANEFYQEGLWKVPVYNQSYYIAMISSNVINFLYMIPLAKGRAKAGTRELKAIYNQLILGVTLSTLCNMVFGLIDYGSALPPYPYLYGCVVWCFILRHTMKTYDFLNFMDKRYEKLFNLNPAAIILVDLQGHIKEANPSAKQFFDSIGLDQANFYNTLHDDFKNRIQAREAIANCEMTIWNENKGRDVLINGDYVMVEYQPHLILIVRDVTAQKENQREITFLAYHDPLTRLPNRRYFYEKLEAALKEADNERHKLAVVLFDLDHFKEINDRYGHLIGDKVLLHVANIVRDIVSSHGTAARLGGDEFVFFLYPVASDNLVLELIHRLRQAIERQKMIVDEEAIPITLSIGASFYPVNGVDGDGLLNSADKALYEVKRKGRNAFRLLSGGNG